MSAACCTHACDEGRDCPRRPAHRVPFNTGKVQIGIAHIPKPAALTADHELVQAALLEPRTTQPQSCLQRLFGRVWRWL